MKLLKKHVYLFAAILLLLPTILLGQSRQLTEKELKVQTDSLKALKLSYTKVNKQMKKEVDSLKAISSELDKKLQTAESELKKFQYKFDIKKYGHEDGNNVFEGKVWKGMTESMLRDSWGKPDKTHTNKYKWGVFTQWYYGDITYFFKNGKLIDWQEKKQ